MKKLSLVFIIFSLLVLVTACSESDSVMNDAGDSHYSAITEIATNGENPMITRIAGTMHIFGIVFLIAAIISGIAAFVAAYDSEEDATEVAKSIFVKCLVFAVILWVIAWLIS